MTRPEKVAQKGNYGVLFCYILFLLLNLQKKSSFFLDIIHG